MKSSLWKILFVLAAVILGAALLVPKALRDKTEKGAEPIATAAQSADETEAIKSASLGFHKIFEAEPAIIQLCAAENKCPLGISAYLRGDGSYILLKDHAFLTEADIEKATAIVSQYDYTPAVNLAFSEIGTQKYCENTAAHIGSAIALVLNGKVISTPRVNEPICGGEGQISNMVSMQGAEELALALNAGTTPAKQRPVD